MKPDTLTYPTPQAAPIALPWRLRLGLRGWINLARAAKPSMASTHLVAKLVEVMEVDYKRVRGGGHVQFDQSAVLPTAPCTVHDPSAVQPTRLTYPAPQPRCLPHCKGYTYVPRTRATRLTLPWRRRSHSLC
jgi:hypothetical protein